MKVQLKFLVQASHINGLRLKNGKRKMKAIIGNEQWVDGVLLMAFKKLKEKFFKTFAKNQTKSIPTFSRLSATCQQDPRQTNGPCQDHTKSNNSMMSTIPGFSPNLLVSDLKESDVSFRIQNGKEMCHHACCKTLFADCMRGCMWKKSFILEINVSSMDTKKNRVIACLIRTIVEDLHTVEDCKFNFTKGILRVVNDNHDDDAVNETDTFYGESVVFSSEFNGSPCFDINEAFAKALEKDDAKGVGAKKVEETEEIKDANLRETIRSDICKNIIMIKEDFFTFCVKLWSEPENKPKIDDKHLQYQGNQRLVITAKMETSNSRFYDNSNPSCFFLGEMDWEDWTQKTLTSANLIIEGFFKTFKDSRWLSRDMVTLHIDETALVITIDTPHQTNVTEEAMVISALLAAFIYDYHALKWNTFKLNCSGIPLVKEVITNYGQFEAEAFVTRNKILTNLKKLRRVGDALKYTRKMVNVLQ